VIRRTLGPAEVWFTDRHGGTSASPYASNNLADHVGDDPTRVGANRHELAHRLAAESASVPADPREWVWLRQVHGATVAGGAPGDPPAAADASVTVTRRRPLVVLTADCAPIALVTDSALAVVHAGWPGLEAGVIAAAVDALRASGTGSVRAVLGPCIHPARYEFGNDLLARLTSRLGDEVRSRTADGAPALDIPLAVRRSLELAGVDALDDVDVCTAASPDHFSHRRDGTTGRQAVVAVLV
jgi:YfiH family protein